MQSEHFIGILYSLLEKFFDMFLHKFPLDFPPLYIFPHWLLCVDFVKYLLLFEIADQDLLGVGKW